MIILFWMNGVELDYCCKLCFDKLSTRGCASTSSAPGVVLRQAQYRRVYKLSDRKG